MGNPVSDEHAAKTQKNFDLLIVALRAAARLHGYALAVHGSLRRDIDLVAVPWVTDVSDAQTLIDAILGTIERGLGYRPLILNKPQDPNYQWDETIRNPVPRPHGRMCWSIHLGGGPYIDLSVMPRVIDPAAGRPDLGAIPEAVR